MFTSKNIFIGKKKKNVHISAGIWFRVGTSIIYMTSMKFIELAVERTMAGQRQGEHEELPGRWTLSGRRLSRAPAVYHHEIVDAY